MNAMTPELFLSQSCKQTREAALSPQADYEARMEAAIAEACAHLTDQNIADEIADISARRREVGYGIIYSVASQHHDTDLLYQLRGELARRQSQPATLNDVTSIVCADVLSGALGSYGKRRA